MKLLFVNIGSDSIDLIESESFSLLSSSNELSLDNLKTIVEQWKPRWIIGDADDPLFQEAKKHYPNASAYQD